MTIQELEEKLANLAIEKKWGMKPEDINFGEKIALIHQEVSEILEAYRNDRFTGRHSLPEEIADVILRVVHLGMIYKVDLVKEIEAKLEINKSRDWSNDPLYRDKK